ncbi:MAG: tripartite tricarboxylate transporter substrate binding protein [Burkholderiales bacterium]|nr:tripartite tricarboxylate transporter substrate binding protein [Burkholderiales bacterium]
MPRLITHCLAATLGLLAAALPAAAQDAWPNRPIRMLIPSAAGAGSDQLARIMAERLGAALKQQIVPDNRPGGNGTIATNAMIKSPPDGYTLLYSNGSFTVMLAALQPDLPFDVMRDLTPVAVTAIGGVVLLVNPSVPAKNLAELIELVKTSPDRYGTYGSWSVGSNGHLTMEWLKNRTGMKITHVPYKGIPSLLTELMSGVLQIGWSDPISPVQFIRAGKLRAIAVNGGARIPQLPDLATFGEQGHPFPALGWQGIFAPPGTPPAIIARLHAEINRIQATPDLQALMTRMNVEPPPIWSTEQFRDMIRNDLQVWKKIVADGKITMDK